MSDAQLDFFRRRLLEMRVEILAREHATKERLYHNESHADPADRATAEEEHFLDLRLREREMTLLRKIGESLRLIDSREYGYCSKTGEPIGISRLLARPTATVCVDVKDRDERRVTHYNERPNTDRREF
ncbi:MAG: RNA polymerase-binding protein DksA [Nevskia sp.]|nr:RNA polymerase-binding protein DksA [Nevskia sp.]